MLLRIHLLIVQEVIIFYDFLWYFNPSWFKFVRVIYVYWNLIQLLPTASFQSVHYKFSSTHYFEWFPTISPFCRATWVWKLIGKCGRKSSIAVPALRRFFGKDVQRWHYFEQETWFESKLNEFVKAKAYFWFIFKYCGTVHLTWWGRATLNIRHTQSIDTFTYFFETLTSQKTRLCKTYLMLNGSLS